MILETERLILDTWQSTDWTAFRPIGTDVEVMRYITGGVPWSDEQIRSFVDRQIELYRTQGFCRWKLLEKPDRNLIGFCGVGFWHDTKEPEIGWRLARPCWGRGLATEAAVPALADAFERGGLGRGERGPGIGWWLARRCWGRGLATEAAVPALRDAFERVGLSRIVSIAMPGNIASTRIMQKLGLEFDRSEERR